MQRGQAFTQMYRNQRGFTPIEIIAVLVLMGIVTAGVLYRTVNSDQVDLMAHTARIRNQIRYAQAMAMKRSEIWGVKCDGGTDTYWLFKNTTSNSVQLPGEKDATISLEDLGVSMSSFSVYFNRLGVPYKSYPPAQPVTGDDQLEITISGNAESVILFVTPQTGLIQ